MLAIRRGTDVEVTKFEHFLIAIGDTELRTLDVCINLFGYEPWAFRISSDWDVEDFQYCVINPILKDKTAAFFSSPNISKVKFIATNYRTTPGPLLEGESEAEWKKRYEPFLNELSEERNKLYIKATLFTELNATDFVYSQIKGMAANKQITISAEAKNRIYVLFPQTPEIDSIISNACFDSCEDNEYKFMERYKMLIEYCQDKCEINDITYTKKIILDT